MVELLMLEGEDAVRRGAADAVRVLEAGGLVLLPGRPFAVAFDEQDLIDPAIGDGKAKNVSLDPATGELRGSSLDGARRAAAEAMIGRFAHDATALIAEIAPAYVPALQRRRTSFRPGARWRVARSAGARTTGDCTSTLFRPTPPTGGASCACSPTSIRRAKNGSGRWARMASRRPPATSAPRLTARGRTAAIKRALQITRGRQSAYDQVMLQLHDAAKLDDAYQATTPKRRVSFPAGSMWAVYTDSVMHAALAGQHAFEQTWLMPVKAMATPELAPVRVLERLLGRALA